MNNNNTKMQASVVNKKQQNNKSKKAKMDKACRWDNVWQLLRTRMDELKYKKGRIATFSVTLGLSLVICFVWMGMLISREDYLLTMLTDVFEVIIAVISVIFVVVMATTIFNTEKSQNIASLELREGYSPRELLLSRFAEFLTEFIAYLLPLIVINLIICGAAGKMHDAMWYKFFVTSLGWYAISMIIAAGLTIFFGSFGGSGASISVGLVIPILLIIFGLIGGIIWPTERKMMNNNEYSQRYLSSLRDSNFKYVDKHIFSHDGTINHDWLKNNPDNSLVDTSLFSNPKTQMSVADFNKGYYLTLGLNVFKGSNENEKLENAEKYIGNNDVAQFMKYMTDYFEKNKMDISYKQVDGFQGYHEGYGAGQWLSNDFLISNEPSDKIFRKLASDKSIKPEYKKAFEQMQYYTNASVMNQFGHMQGNELLNQGPSILYPTWDNLGMYNFAVAANTEKIKNSKNDFNPAEIIFFKDFIGYYSQYLGLNKGVKTFYKDGDLGPIKTNNNGYNPGNVQTIGSLDLTTGLLEVTTVVNNANESNQLEAIKGLNDITNYTVQIPNGSNMVGDELANYAQVKSANVDGDKFNIEIQITSDEALSMLSNLDTFQLSFYYHNFNFGFYDVSVVNNPNMKVQVKSVKTYLNKKSGDVTLRVTLSDTPKNIDWSSNSVPNIQVLFGNDMENGLFITGINNSSYSQSKIESVDGNGTNLIIDVGNEKDYNGKYKAYSAASRTTDGILYINGFNNDKLFGFNPNPDVNVIAAHNTSISMIYDTFAQFSLMMNGVDYHNLYAMDVLSSQGGLYELIGGAPITSMLVEDGGILKPQRVAYPEILYLCYFIVNALLVFGGAAIYEKKYKI